MTLFQCLSVPTFAWLLLYELSHLSRGCYGARLVRSATWLAAGLAILRPSLTTQLAVALGVQRGADLVNYLTVLAFLASAFYGYACYVRLQRQLTVLARRMAILTARQVSGAPGTGRETAKEATL